jgi:DNA-binding SARP family transcriptional activator
MATRSGGTIAAPCVDIAGRWSLRLSDSWRLSDGDTELPMRDRAQRLLALLALQGRRPRIYLAGILWPDSTESHASGSLRATVWQIGNEAPGLLVQDRRSVGLHPEIQIDVRDVTACADRIAEVARKQTAHPVSYSELNDCLAQLVGGELLPGWYADWVVFERARLQQVRLRALETLAELLLARGMHSQALTAAMAAIAIEPLRESAVRALIGVHIADGNFSEALHEYHAFHRRLMRELGVPPSPQLEALMRPLLARQLVTKQRFQTRVAAAPA